jgi:hypothetical protein
VEKMNKTIKKAKKKTLETIASASSFLLVASAPGIRLINKKDDLFEKISTVLSAWIICLPISAGVDIYNQIRDHTTLYEGKYSEVERHLTIEHSASRYHENRLAGFAIRCVSPLGNVIYNELCEDVTRISPEITGSKHIYILGNDIIKFEEDSGYYFNEEELIGKKVIMGERINASWIADKLTFRYKQIDGEVQEIQDKIAYKEAQVKYYLQEKNYDKAKKQDEKVNDVQSDLTELQNAQSIVVESLEKSVELLNKKYSQEKAKERQEELQYQREINNLKQKYNQQ